jgi:hypothetical protein
MLENTHRFAIHIRICKEATDEDRATALGQLHKTKKYGMKVNRKPDSDLDKFMRHPEVSKIINDHLASLVALSAHETLPAGSSLTMIQHDHYSSHKHYGLDDHMKFSAPVRDAQTKNSCLPMLELKDASVYCPSSMVSAASNVSGDDYFDSCYHYYAPPPSAVYSAAAATSDPTDVLARETARYRISDSHHNLNSPDISTKTFYERHVPAIGNDTFQLLDPMTQCLRHECYQTPGITSSRYHQQQQQHSSSWRVPYSPSFIEPDAPPLDSQSCLF